MSTASGKKTARGDTHRTVQDEAKSPVFTDWALCNGGVRQTSFELSLSSATPFLH